MAEAATDSPPEKGTPEYNEAMTARYEKGLNDQNNTQTFEAPPVEIAAIPEGGHDKFYNKETGEYHWQNHSKELQYRIDQQGKNTKHEPISEETTEVTSSAVNWEELSNKLGETQTLESADYEQLQGIGIPKEVIDSYLQLLATGNEAAQTQAISYAGGPEAMDQLFGWAQQNLTEDEIGNYNNILASPNWRMAIDSLRVASGSNTETTNEVAREPELVEGQSSISSGTGFASTQEMMAAMSDPKYKSDPAFRNQVRMRVGRSNF